MGAVDLLASALRPDQVRTGDDVSDDYGHDECLTVGAVAPAAVLLPESVDDVVAIVKIANEHRVPITARGSGTGLSGACVPRDGGVVVSFERMNRILEIDTANHMAVVEPGVTLEQLDEALGPHGLVYPVFPGELSASIGGNVNTNAGGMRAVKYGVTRHHVIGLQLVLATGEVVRTGGKVVKATTGYDMTQLVIGSEGTLALVTEITIKLYPRPAHTATVLVPFSSADDVAEAVPKIVASGIGPVILEYIDMLTMAAITTSANLELGIPQDMRETAAAYLVVVMEGMHAERVDEDVLAVSELAASLGALDVYVLPPNAGAALVAAREKAFWVAKANGADDIVDVVVPRASVPEYLRTVATLAEGTQSWVAGCGHAGDGNVHLSVFQKDPARRKELLTAIFRAGMDLGGAISGEHGVGEAKKAYFLELEDPVKLALLHRIKGAFDPNRILNPGAMFD